MTGSERVPRSKVTLVLQTKKATVEKLAVSKHARIGSSPSVLNRPSIPTDTLSEGPVEEDGNESFLAPVGEVVVPSAQVVVISPLGDLLGAQVKVGSSVIQLRHLASKLACDHKPEMLASRQDQHCIVKVSMQATNLESGEQGSGVIPRPDPGRFCYRCQSGVPGNCSPSDQT